MGNKQNKQTKSWLSEKTSKIGKSSGGVYPGKKKGRGGVRREDSHSKKNEDKVITTEVVEGFFFFKHHMTIVLGQ